MIEYGFQYNANDNDIHSLHATVRIFQGSTNGATVQVIGHE
jgi:hypothetical protein